MRSDTGHTIYISIKRYSQKLQLEEAHVTRIIFAAGVAALIGIVAYAIFAKEELLDPQALIDSVMIDSERCGKMVDPEVGFVEWERSGLILKREPDQLTVSDSAWFNLDELHRAGIVLLYGCVSGRDTIRVVSSEDGRILGQYEEGQFSEKND